MSNDVYPPVNSSSWEDGDCLRVFAAGDGPREIRPALNQS